MYVVISVYTTSFSWTLLSPSKILTKMWYLGWVEEERVGTIWRYLNYFYCCKTKIYPIQINVCNRKYFSAALSHARGTISLMQHYLKLVRPFLLMQHLLRSIVALWRNYTKVVRECVRTSTCCCLVVKLCMSSICPYHALWRPELWWFVVQYLRA